MWTLSINCRDQLFLLFSELEMEPVKGPFFPPNDINAINE